MKSLFTLILLLLSLNLFANDKILGFWLSESGKGVVEIYLKDNLYFGKMVWLEKEHSGKANPALDINNPDKAKQARKLNGLNILTNFKYENGEYKNGQIYDPKKGKTYSAFMELENDNKLKLRGYMGISLFGRTSHWTRQKSKIPDELLKK